ncbi:hypothetical protein XFLM_05710 [Xylella fastidiosa subsp. fastidiosa GB514]|jgi:hypothetical protein|uniref:Uncharacterized protein n=1 Tax=Xylella fastidiosa subsp. sandyi Ann-1 TaxID=155920 RepID=A0A060H5Z4_XYLFS|nr:hypothetical protein XFLM_05710 [Xylella fastidiosa subsp. fastidiosa GB514]AIC10973.1 hypothetical protein D934_01405 [Xylella fastidiosa subsp. sandyi Ann-1]AIC14107.1 hypothetical protein P303_11480 [Xylella fastidiosa MUL0034]EWG13920.1 hypothetical protein P910_002844 [Xylella fastidiosa Mul-MD]KAF0570472.1 hypothetical protein P305_09865 [Xylella fastidiosa subsp. fastidiosa Mus-1]
MAALSTALVAMLLLWLAYTNHHASSMWDDDHANQATSTGATQPHDLMLFL